MKYIYNREIVAEDEFKRRFYSEFGIEYFAQPPEDDEEATTEDYEAALAEVGV